MTEDEAYGGIVLFERWEDFLAINASPESNDTLYSLSIIFLL